jgi:signal transduction histidine kinase
MKASDAPVVGDPMQRSSVASEGDDLGATPADGVRDLTPYPPSLAAAGGSSARISTVTESVHVPALWLDRLLTLAHEVPLDQGEASLVRALVLGLGHVLPGVRVAIQLAPAQATTDVRRVLWTEPPKSDERLRPERVFPDVAYERSVTLPGPVASGSLHFAADEDLLSADSSPHVQLQERAAVVVAHAIARSRAVEQATSLRRELRAAEAQMVQVEKLASLGQIAAGMVHELNNPLTSIAAYTDFLIRRAAARPNAEPDDVERLRRIAESANRLLRFTRDLVSYARPSGDVPIQVHLNGVIERALAFCEHEIVGVGVVVERTLDPQIGMVRGLPEQLAQVFVNLITNACHAMARDHQAPADDRAPVLSISSAHLVPDAGLPSRISIVVADTGCGIAKENLPLIFTPFFTTKAAGRGTGLGLSIVKKIVDGHGGDIRAESEGSRGTRFVLTFPVDVGGNSAGDP